MHIFGREPISIKCKATRRKPQAIGAMPLVEISATILDLHPTVTLSMDYVFIQGIPMLYSILSGYKFRIIEAVIKMSVSISYYVSLWTWSMGATIPCMKTVRFWRG